MVLAFLLRLSLSPPPFLPRWKKPAGAAGQVQVVAAVAETAGVSINANANQRRSYASPPTGGMHDQDAMMNQFQFGQVA